MIKDRPGDLAFGVSKKAGQGAPALKKGATGEVCVALSPDR